MTTPRLSVPTSGPMTREQWLQFADALDSGEYKQLRNRLVGAARNGEEDWTKACCLGVCTAVIHGKEWGYPDSNGLMTEEQQERFVILNDEKNWSFAQIAEFIRTNVDTLAAGQVPS